MDCAPETPTMIGKITPMTTYDAWKASEPERATADDIEVNLDIPPPRLHGARPISSASVGLCSAPRAAVRFYRNPPGWSIWRRVIWLAAHIRLCHRVAQDPECQDCQ